MTVSATAATSAGMPGRRCHVSDRTAAVRTRRVIRCDGLSTAAQRRGRRQGTTADVGGRAGSGVQHLRRPRRERDGRRVDQRRAARRRQHASAASFFVTGANGAMQGSNYTQELKDAGLSAPERAHEGMGHQSGVGGGPDRKDKLWFFGTLRCIGAPQLRRRDVRQQERRQPDYVDLRAGPDPPASERRHLERARGMRLTWQATPRNKFNLFWDEQQPVLHGASGRHARRSRPRQPARRR